jgi:hypothetical protein
VAKSLQVGSCPMESCNFLPVRNPTLANFVFQFFLPGLTEKNIGGGQNLLAGRN